MCAVVKSPPGISKPNTTALCSPYLPMFGLLGASGVSVMSPRSASVIASNCLYTTSYFICAIYFKLLIDSSIKLCSTVMLLRIPGYLLNC